VLKINEAAFAAGVTVRTLHYYDEIGLLKPSEITDTGYRLYDDAALAVLQQILFFRELDFPLGEIRDIISSPAFDRTKALENHRELLLRKRERLDNLINLVDNIIKGEDSVSFKEFDLTEIEESRKKFADEVKERWGNTAAYLESERKTKDYGAVQWQQIFDEGSHIFEAFAANKDKAPESVEVQKLVGMWQAFITDKYYKCTNEILACLGQMYIGDERFTKNIDRYGVGTANFLAKAIEIYCKNEAATD
jgi:DNA-binding transcriptional MerR regulator